jgi:hypothetical protein
VPNQNTKKHLEEVKEFEKSGYAFFFLFVKIADHTQHSCPNISQSLKKRIANICQNTLKNQTFYVDI